MTSLKVPLEIKIGLWLFLGLRNHSTYSIETKYFVTGYVTCYE